MGISEVRGCKCARKWKNSANIEYDLGAITAAKAEGKNER